SWTLCTASFAVLHVCFTSVTFANVGSARTVSRWACIAAFRRMIWPATWSSNSPMVFLPFASAPRHVLCDALLKINSLGADFERAQRLVVRFGDSQSRCVCVVPSVSQVGKIVNCVGVDIATHEFLGEPTVARRTE